MRHEFYTFVFEKFPDGSSLWRACESGRHAGERKMQELAVRSVNEFFAIDIQVEATATDLAIKAGPDTTALSVDSGSVQTGS
jgi:hypothetical protein